MRRPDLGGLRSAPTSLVEGAHFAPRPAPAPCVLESHVPSQRPVRPSPSVQAPRRRGPPLALVPFLGAPPQPSNWGGELRPFAALAVLAEQGRSLDQVECGECPLAA